MWRRTRGTVAERIEAIPVGGTRFDLTDHLQLERHRRLRTKDGMVNRSATGSYGRVRLDEPAPTMTTRCPTPARGAFIHPTEHRGLSLREAATLQTFPATYRWYGGYDSVERQIGNAVPVWMAEALGRAVLRLLDGHDDGDDALLVLHPTANRTTGNTDAFGALGPDRRGPAPPPEPMASAAEALLDFPSL